MYVYAKGQELLDFQYICDSEGLNSHEHVILNALESPGLGGPSRYP